MLCHRLFAFLRASAFRIRPFSAIEFCGNCRHHESRMTAALQSHGRDLTFGSVPRHLVAFSLPILLGNLIQAAYSF